MSTSARAQHGAALMGLLVLAGCAACLVGCGSTHNGPAALTPAVQVLKLPPPSELARSVSYADTDRILMGREHSVILPSNRVAPHWVCARFMPDWDAQTSPEPAGLAYATYTFILEGYSDAPQLYFGWTAEPDQGSIWIGLAHWERDAWQWRHLPPNNMLSFLSLEPYISTTGAILVTVLATGTQPSTLAWLRCGERVGRWQTETVDASGDIDRYNSLALDASGLPQIAYREAGDEDLKYAYNNGVFWDTEVVAGSDRQGSYASLALSSTGLPRIASLNVDTKRLEYHYHDGVGWQVEIPDNSGDVGWNASLALDSAGLPHIIYRSIIPGELRYVFFDGAVWQRQLVASGSEPGMSGSLLIHDDHPCMAFGDESLKTAHYAWHNGINWVVEQIDSNYMVGGTDLALDAAGRPHVSLYMGEPSPRLKHDYFDGSSWINEDVQLLPQHNGKTGIAVVPNGWIHISYVAAIDEQWALRHAWHDGGEWQTEVVENCTEPMQSDTSLALDPSGRPCISYVFFEPGSTDGVLKCAIQID
jgi:hypothetical protein